MTATDVIREYLVKLGFQVDTAAYKRMHDLLDGLTKKIGTSTSDMGKKYLKYGAIAASAITAIDTALVAQVGKTIKADMEYQKFALHMYTAPAMAKKVSIAMATMGESIEDMANIPELRENFNKLMLLMDKLKPKNMAEDEKEYRRLRDIAFQFKELSVTGKFFADQMVASLARKLSPELDYVSNKLKSMQEFFIEHRENIVESVSNKLKTMATVTKAVAGTLGVIAAGFLAFKGWGILKNIGGFGKNLWDGIKGNAQLSLNIAKAKAIEAATGVQPVFLTNPEDIKGGAVNNATDTLRNLGSLGTLWGVMKGYIAAGLAYMVTLIGGLSIGWIIAIFVAILAALGLGWLYYKFKTDPNKPKEQGFVSWSKDYILDAPRKAKINAEAGITRNPYMGFNPLKNLFNFNSNVDVTKNANTPQQEPTVNVTTNADLVVNTKDGTAVVRNQRTTIQTVPAMQ